MSTSDNDHLPKVPKPLLQRYLEVTAITDDVCGQSIDGEYVLLCREMTAALCRKRPSPIVSGSVQILAGSIAYTIASINFLFDPTQEPHLTQQQLCDAFGVKRRTAHEKSNEIMKLLKTQQADPKWWRPSRMLDNPFAWFVQTETGFILDARNMSREFQEAAYEAGAIPFIP